MDAAMAAPALALALREFPASVSTEPSTVADIDLQRAILRTVRCGYAAGMHADWHGVGVYVGCCLFGFCLCWRDTPREGPPSRNSPADKPTSGGLEIVFNQQ